MFNILIIIILGIIGIKFKEENVLLILLFFLPFHFFVKQILIGLAIDASIFSVWKEILALILLIRVFIRKQPIFSFPLAPLLIIGIPLTIKLMVADNLFDGLTSYKNFVFPILLAILCSRIKISEIFIHKLPILLSISALIVCIISLLQYYVFKLEFAFLMGIVDDISSSGYIKYNAGALRIDDKERIYGPFAGPNELGLYASFIITIIFGSVIIPNRGKLKRFEKTVITAATLFLMIILFLTFSRVSWVITLLCNSYLIVKFRNYLNIKFVVYSSIGILTASLWFLPIQEISLIANRSINLEEASASDRPNEFYRGIDIILSNPMGVGLGNAHYNSSARKFDTEIFWWMVIMETGIIIGFMIFLTYLFCFVKLHYINRIRILSFVNATKIAVFSTIVAGFGSIIVFEPIYGVYLWSFIGLSFNNKFIESMISNQYA